MSSCVCTGWEVELNKSVHPQVVTVPVQVKTYKEKKGCIRQKRHTSKGHLFKYFIQIFLNLNKVKILPQRSILPSFSQFHPCKSSKHESGKLQRATCSKIFIEIFQYFNKSKTFTKRTLMQNFIKFHPRKRPGTYGFQKRTAVNFKGPPVQKYSSKFSKILTKVRHLLNKHSR